jgi:hypothetical protein
MKTHEKKNKNFFEKTGSCTKDVLQQQLSQQCEPCQREDTHHSHHKSLNDQVSVVRFSHKHSQVMN